MNSSDPAETVEVAKAHVAAHDASLNEKKAYSLDKDLAITPSIEEVPAATTDDADYPKTFPTDEELKSLRRVCGTIPWTSYSVAFVELCERFSYYGTTAVCMSIRVHTQLNISKLTCISRQLYPASSAGWLHQRCNLGQS
jgi:POT family proton-dependent oligopeptide transporter